MKRKTTEIYTLTPLTEVFANILEKVNEVFGNYCHAKFFEENSPLNLNK